jgi:RNA 2',3'-cyclic 3'-phosphodiesterase
MVRAFIAIELTPGIRDRIRESQEILKQSTARLTLVDPGSIHLTLKFLGEVMPDRIPSVCNALHEIREVPFEMTIGGISGNNPSRPRVIWCTIQDGGASASLAHRVEEALVPLGFEREGRPFTPHATVARVREYDPSLQKPLKELSGREHGTCIVKGFSVKKSTLTPRGPIYEDIMRVAW